MCAAAKTPETQGDSLVISEMDRLLATQQLNTLMMDYWYDVDTNWGRNAGDYYTDDAVFIGGAATYTGKEQIKAFYQWRIDRGVQRPSIHGVSNFRVVLESPTQATSTWYLLLYAADGTPPLPTHPPIHMSLVTDICVKGADGKWRYKSRKFDTLFEGGAKPTNPDLSKK